MRVLHVLHSLNQAYGGPLRAVLDLSARALVFGLDSEVLGFGAPDIKDNPLPRRNLHALPISSPRKYCYSPHLSNWLDENLHRYQGIVLHGMWLYPNWLICEVAATNKIPYACFPHGMLNPWAVYGQGRLKSAKKFLYWHLRERTIFKHARCVFFTTERERELAAATFNLEGQQMLLMPYGVDVSPERIQTPAREDLWQAPENKVALFLGRLDPKKNVDLLIKAWKLAKPPKPWRLVIAGSGPRDYVSHLERLAAEGTVNSQIQMVGFVSGTDKSYLLQRASWFLLPSKQENFGVAVIEAISHGSAVAVSDQVYVADSLDPRTDVLPLDLRAWQSFLETRMQNQKWQEISRTMNIKQLTATMNIDAVAHAWSNTLIKTFEQ